MITYLKRKFFGLLYKVKPPEAVKFQTWGEGKRARIGHAEDGSFQMIIKDEKYPYPGFPRGHILMGDLAKIKHRIKQVLNASKADIQEVMKEAKVNMLPVERMQPPVRELWRVFEELENAEITSDMKERIRLYRDVACFWLSEDDAYRFRLQWFLERLNIKKVRLSKEDKYFFRGKYFKTDYDTFEY